MPSTAESIAQAAAMHRGGQLQQAEQLCRQVLQADPGNVEAWFLLGAICHDAGRPSEAAAHLQQAVQRKPDHAEAVHRLGIVLLETGNLEAAEACFRRAVTLRPAYAAAHGNLGTLLQQHGRLDEAVACFRLVLEWKPDSVEAHYNLGLIAWQQGRNDEAVTRFRRTLQLKPDVAEAHHHLGVLLANQRKFDEAADCFRNLIELQPENAEAHNFLGAALSEQGRLDEGGSCFQRAIELDPDNAELQLNLGTFLRRRGKLNESVECFERAIELKPDFAEAHQARGLALLLLGRFAEGWPDYEWRLKCRGSELPPLPKPRWTGEESPGARILLRSEQGLGDTLQFIRYAEPVKQRGTRVIVQCQAPLARLLQDCRGVDQVVRDGDPLPEFDYQVPLVSLPGVFDTRLETVPAQVPYLLSDAKSVEAWRAEWSGVRALKVGISWRGSRAYMKDQFRSIPLAHFVGIARMPGVQVYSLQLGEGREELAALGDEAPIVDLGDRLGDFFDTAAIVRNLDLVISCDSAPVHLAGALGVPVWVALAIAPDWRWMLDRTDSPWYPTVRLFRQGQPGDWESVFGAMESELAKLVQTRSRSSISGLEAR